VTLSFGAMAQWRFSAMTLRAMTLWLNGALAQWRNDGWRSRRTLHGAGGGGAACPMEGPATPPAVIEPKRH